MYVSPETIYNVLIITYYGTSQFIYLNIQVLKKDMFVVCTITSIVTDLITKIIQIRLDYIITQMASIYKLFHVYIKLYRH